MDFDTDVLQPVFIFSFAVIELLINLVCVPVSALNFFLVFKTSVIHPNLKHILIYQSACILGRGMCRFIVCLLKFVLLSPMDSEHFATIATIYSLFIFERNSMAHVLIIERVLATMTAKSYEHMRKPIFTLGWLIVVIPLSLYNSIDYKGKGLINLLTNFALLLTAGVELFVFSLLRSYSENAYRRTLHSTKGHNLSERYQLSENVRIGKQLIPTLVLHLFNLLSSTFITAWYFFGFPAANYVMIFCATFSSFCSLMIEFSIIMCHPFLKREFAHILNKFLIASRPSRVAENTVNMANDGRTTKIAMTNLLNGKALEIEQKQEVHFDMLSKMWN